MGVVLCLSSYRGIFCGTTSDVEGWAKRCEFTRPQQSVSNLVKVALPDYAGYIDAHGPAGYFSIIEPLEAKLLKMKLRRMMKGAGIRQGEC